MYILTGIVHGSFLFLLEGNQVKLISRHNPTVSYAQMSEEGGDFYFEGREEHEN